MVLFFRQQRLLLALTFLTFVASLGLAPQQPGKQDPYIAFEYGPRNNFGLLVLKDPDGKKVKKQLTFDTMGQTNGTLVRIDAKDVEFGGEGGKFVIQGTEKDVPSRSVWKVGNVEISQILEIIQGKSGKLDTLLVRYVFENKDTKAHKVGLRVMIDSAIGAPENDGVPFQYAGGSELVTTFKDFPEGSVPEWVEALENPNLKDPGTIAVLTLKVGKQLEPPARASITLWPGAAPSAWDIPLESFSPEGSRKDSCLVLYWNAEELQPGKRRELGYGFGTRAKVEEVKASKPEMPPVIEPPATCCKGDISVQHAQCALKRTLGIIPDEPPLDVDLDGKVTEKDVLALVRQAMALVKAPEALGEVEGAPGVGEITVSVPNIQAKAGEEIEVPITLAGANRLGCLQMGLNYDKTVLQIKSVEKGPVLAEGAVLEVDESIPGRLIVGLLSGANAKKTGLARIGQDGILFKVRFVILGQAGQKSPLSPHRTQAWEVTDDPIPVRTTDGQLSVPTPPTVAAREVPWNYLLFGAAAVLLIMLGVMRRLRVGHNQV
ncbi:MAG TPA: cohesin domain-containing protein [Gemmataceae bacterium]|nr:cohesin domain-containing protein [Gemmataceae bacterium]